MAENTEWAGEEIPFLVWQLNDEPVVTAYHLVPPRFPEDAEFACHYAVDGPSGRTWHINRESAEWQYGNLCDAALAEFYGDQPETKGD